MSVMIAYCGLDCAVCPAYQATQADDQSALEKIAEAWRAEYHAPGINVKDVICDGCTASLRQCSHCGECNIRACSVKRGYQNCAECPDFICADLNTFFGMAPIARQNLEQIRSSPS